MIEIDGLEDIIQDYENLRKSFRDFTRNSDNNKQGLIEFEGRFIDLKANLRQYKNKIRSEFRTRGDKQATALKSRIAVQISEGSFNEFEQCTFSKAKDLAPATDAYKIFLEESVFFEESFANLNDIYEIATLYINEIKDRIK